MTSGSMPRFSPVVVDSWALPAADGENRLTVLVRVQPSPSAGDAISYLRVVDGPGVLALSPASAEALALSDGDRLDPATLDARLRNAGVVLHDPDHVFHLLLDAQEVLRAEPTSAGTRRLTAHDTALFEAFTAEAPKSDLDDAFVELDHWLVVGTVMDNRLVSAASMYPWRGTRLADLGVITLPAFRGRGIGRATVRAISAAALELGYEPQYRCQHDNAASIALARAAGFAVLGDWRTSLTED